jgi:UDP-N-acetylglucosamine 2-epimerase (non-hydrolysing)
VRRGGDRVKVACVVGARPNFVKIAPILAEMRQCDRLSAALVHTGQHYDSRMSDSFFQDLEIPAPDINLGVTADNPPLQVADIIAKLTPVLSLDPPDVVLVVGDVNSTLAAALVAVKLGIRLAHVEAGLRSFDRTMPEEINRILTDAVADLCFTSEPAGAENLAREGVAPERIHHVGNVMIDSLFRFRERAKASPILERLGLARERYAVLTLHRPANVDDPETLRHALTAIAPIAAEVPIVFAVHPRTRRRLDGVLASTGGGLRPVDPVPYLDFVKLMTHAQCVLTDSGGIQEETTALGVPCLTLRTTTERPITVTQGTNRIVALDVERIASAWDDIRRGAWSRGRLPDLWDGHAARRIVAILRAYAG